MSKGTDTYMTKVLSRIGVLCCAAAAMGLVACDSGSGIPQEQTLASQPVDGDESAISGELVKFDKKTSADGNGSWRIDARGETQARLLDVPLSGVDDTRLVYRAKMRAEALNGKAYLEMWARLPDQNEYFSRNINAPLTGTTDWVSVQTPFLLKKGEQPDLIKLNVVVEGAGRIWIDEIELVQVTTI